MGLHVVLGSIMHMVWVRTTCNSLGLYDPTDKASLGR